MTRERKAAGIQPYAKDRSQKLLAEPFTGLGLNSSTIGVEIGNVNERGVIVLPNGFSKELDNRWRQRARPNDVSGGGVRPTLVSVHISELIQDSSAGVLSGNDNGSD